MSTRGEVLAYLVGKHPWPQEWMRTPLSAFGGISAGEYGKIYGWEYVMATARRIFGGNV